MPTRWIPMPVSVRRLVRFVGGSVRDLAPIAAVIVFFQVVVIREPFPDTEAVLIGSVFVVVGLMLFVRGLELGLFPLGEALADAFARRGSLRLLLVFAFALGFGTTIAEPALVAVAGEAARAVVEAGPDPVAAGDSAAYAWHLRLTVAVSVGVALVVGVLRIVKGWPLHYLIVAGYLAVVALTAAAPPQIIGIAYDSGGVTTSCVTVPLVAALGVGLASAIRRRSPLVDGFGLIAFASLTPIVFVLMFGIFVHGG